MQIDHIGYVVKNLEKALVEFEKLGYEKCSTFFDDEKRKVRILFIKKNENEKQNNSRNIGYFLMMIMNS